MKILIVEDDSYQRHMLKGILGKGLHEIVEASCRNEAFGFIHNESFDLIITDLKMPIRKSEEIRQRSGLEIIAELRAFGKPGTRIWLVSGNMSDEIRAEALKRGAEKAIQKGSDLLIELQAAKIVP